MLLPIAVVGRKAERALVGPPCRSPARVFAGKVDDDAVDDVVPIAVVGGIVKFVVERLERLAEQQRAVLLVIRAWMRGRVVKDVAGQRERAI